MITVMLQILCLVLIVYLAGGAWCARARRRGLLSERDFERAERARARYESVSPDESALLTSLDAALRETLEEPGCGQDVRSRPGERGAISAPQDLPCRSSAPVPETGGESLAASRTRCL